MKTNTITDFNSPLENAARRAIAHCDRIATRSILAVTEAVAALDEQVGSRLPDEPLEPELVIDELDRLFANATVATTSPRYFGFVTGGAVPASVAASWLTAAWDQNAFTRVSSPAGAAAEEITLHWLVDLLGLPASCGAAFTSGASIANFTALAAARHALLSKTGWDVERHGLFGAPELHVYISEEQHPTVRKALGLLGLGRERVTLLPCDAQGRIRTGDLPRLREPALVCAQAGNVNSGASDPFDALRDWSSEAGAWLHVDGAFGLWAQASPDKRPQVAGVARADSWATDAHKWLNVPYDSGLAFVRDPAALQAAMSFSAAYLPAEGPREPFHYTAEASRRARGFEIWAALRSLGRSGVTQLIDRCCAHARRFAEGLSEAGYEVLNDVALNQVVVSFGDRERCDAVIARIQEEGVCWCGPTEWRGRAAMRISVSNWATSEEDIERSLASILRCAG